MRSLGRKSGDNGVSGSSADEVEGAADMLDLTENWAEGELTEFVENEPKRAMPAWLTPAAAMLLVAAWSGFYLYAYWTAMTAGAPPQQWAQWTIGWTVPIALIGIVWLLVMRSSQAEGRRFAATAGLMNRESAALEARLKVVNRELSLAREFLAAQSRDLETLGRLAAERLSANAGELQALITANGAQVSAVATASDTALGNMNRLRDDLPVIANAARDVANQIGSAGRVADEQLASLSGGFDNLSAAGAKNERQIEAVATRVSEVLSTFETQLDTIAQQISERFGALRSETEAYRSTVGTLESEALDALRSRVEIAATEADAMTARLLESSENTETRLLAAIATLHEAMVERLKVVEDLDRTTSAAASQRIAQLRDEALRFDTQLEARNRSFDEMMEGRHAAFETQSAQSIEVLGQRLAALDDALAQRRETQMADIAMLVAQGDAMAEQVAQLSRRIEEAGEAGDTARAKLTAPLDTLAQQLADKRAALAATEADIAQLTHNSVRLLEILQSGTRICRDDLGEAIGNADRALETVEQRAAEVDAVMLRSAAAGRDLSAYLVQTRAGVDDTEQAIADLRSQLAQDSDDALARLQGLKGGYVRLAADSKALAGETQEALRDALGELETAIKGAFATLDDGARSRLVALADTLGKDAVEALERALRNETAATLGKLEQSAAHASGVGREAAIQLRDQLVKVNELTGNLEQRVARARDLAEEQVNNDFTRRMALITDSLNSAAIDITAALSTEVTDTAWEAYLKGDRGIFTRRAVRLIDNGTAREIAGLYTSDEMFRSNVSRYIHDFEALLRQTLSTRDGHVLSVTMLGSDMGKLYVALAQSIQRLRA